MFQINILLSLLKISDGEYWVGGNNTSYNDESYKKYLAEDYRRYVRFMYSVWTLDLLLALLGIVANYTVCGVLLRKKRLAKNFSNFHLFNVGFTDIVYRLALVPSLITVKNIKVEHRSVPVFKLAAFSHYTTLAVTFTLLLGITFDRYLHIVYPIKARYITWKHGKNVVILSSYIIK